MKHFTPPKRHLTTPACCHACGQYLGPRLFVGIRQSVFELILANPGINSEELTDIIYKDQDFGSSVTIRETIARMRHILNVNGYLLIGRNGPRGGYTLRINEAP